MSDDRFVQDELDGITFHDDDQQYDDWMKSKHPKVAEMRSVSVKTDGAGVVAESWNKSTDNVSLMEQYLSILEAGGGEWQGPFDGKRGGKYWISPSGRRSYREPKVRAKKKTKEVPKKKEAKKAKGLASTPEDVFDSMVSMGLLDDEGNLTDGGQKVRERVLAKRKAEAEAKANEAEAAPTKAVPEKDKDYLTQEFLQKGAAESLSKRGEKWASKLSQEEKAAVVEYTGDNFKKINEQLISGKVTGKLKSQVDRINSAIAKAGPINVEVYKGIKTGGSLSKKLAKGGEIEFKNFNSTSLDAGLAAGYSDFKDPTVLVIKAKTGAYVDTITEWDNEQELLQKSGTRYKVTGQGSLKNIPLGKGTQNAKAFYLEEI